MLLDLEGFLVNEHDRYSGKPLLRLLECYVLWAIDELPDEVASTLENMTPKLQEIYHKGGSWQDIVAGTVKMPPDSPEEIRRLWKGSLQLDDNGDRTISAQQFAETLVDSNLVS